MHDRYMLHALPAAERAYEHVKGLVISGQLPGGEMISEGEIAAALEMSRTPVREAFLRLEVEGFLTLYPKRGAVVTPISADEVREVYEARLVIDRHAAAFLCEQPKATRRNVTNQLQHIVDKQNAALDAGDLAGYAGLDAEFHQTIMDHGGNSILAQLGHSLRERQQRFTATALRRNIATAREFVSSHARLIDALARGDRSAYDREITTHLNLSRNQL